MDRFFFDTAADAAQTREVLEAAVAAPGHDQILPWRFVSAPVDARANLADAFVQALVARDPQVTTLAPLPAGTP